MADGLGLTAFSTIASPSNLKSPQICRNSRLAVRNKISSEDGEQFYEAQGTAQIQQYDRLHCLMGRRDQARGANSNEMAPIGNLRA